MTKIKTENDDLAEAFCHTVLNQYFFDERAYINFNRKITDFNGIPRPSKWLGKNRFILSIILKYSNYLRFFWSYIFSYILFTVQALNCCTNLAIKKNLYPSFRKTLALAACNRSF